MRSKTLVVLLIFFVVPILLVSCSDCDGCGCDCESGFEINLFSPNRREKGSGTLVSESHQVDGFKAVVLSEKGDLFIEQGENESLIIEAEDNFQEYLQAEVQNGILEIYKSPPHVTLDTTKPIRYYLTVKDLESLTVKNSGDVQVSEIIGESFSVVISGSGSVYIDAIDVERLKAKLTSSGNLEISEGFAKIQDIELSSSGEYDGSRIEGQRAFVSVSSSGNATFNVSEIIEASLTSSGSVYYFGNPKIKYQSSSSGEVERVR
jgi:hypothetical protein